MDIEFNFCLHPMNPEKGMLAMFGTMPADWHDQPFEEMMDLHIVPAIMQLREEARRRAHKQFCICETRDC